MSLFNASSWKLTVCRGSIEPFFFLSTYWEDSLSWTEPAASSICPTLQCFTKVSFTCLSSAFCSYAVLAAFQREYFLLLLNFCSNSIQIGVHCSRICMITNTISASVSLSDLHLCPPPSIIWLHRNASFPLIVVALLPVRVQPNVAAFTPLIRKYLNASVIQCNWTTRVTWTPKCCITLNEKH